MMNLAYYLSLGAAAIATVVAQGSDPCTNYQSITEPERDFTKYVDPGAGSLVCDRLLQTGWYRFTHGEMPFGTCVPAYHCGTHVPLWVNGTIPMVSDGIVNRRACGTMHSDCCGASADIQVKNCNMYLVYRLVSTRGCSFAYCAGNHAICRNDQRSPTGFAPCYDAYPKLTSNLQLRGPIITGTDFKFTCSLPFPAAYQDGVFTVTWLLNGHPVGALPTETLRWAQCVAVVYGDQLQGHMGQTLSCSVKTAFSNNTARQSPAYTSNGYWMGVKYSMARLTVDDARHNMPLNLISTVPVVCKTPGSQKCNVDFLLTTDNDNISTDKCNVTMTPTDWNPMTHNAVTQVHVTAKPDIIIRPTSVTHIMTSSIGDNVGNIWSFAQVPVVTIETTDRGGATCSLTGDPHIVSFDEKRHHYNLYTQGQYYALLGQAENFRVDIRTWWCGRGVTCICGVVAREGNDVISVDMCHGRIGKTYAKFEIKNAALFTNKTEIVRDGSRLNYVLNFQSGAYVKINVGKTMKYMNVHIYVPSSFRAKTKGLCGYFDGSSANDRTLPDGSVAPSSMKLPVHFTNSWSIPKGQSLFERVEQVTRPPPTPYCSCQAPHAGSCSSRTPDIPTSLLCPGCSPVGPYSTGPTTPPGSHTQTTPATASSFTTPYPFNSSSVPPPQFPTMPPVSQTSAMTYCSNLLTNNTGARECVKDLNYELPDIMDMCITDVMLTGDHELALSALNLLMESCGFKILTNPIKYTHTGNTTLVPPPSAKVCPGVCNGKGECNNGICTCELHFEGSDCSIDTRHIPKLAGVDGGNACDSSLNTGDCFRPVMIGENFTPQSVCIYIPLAYVNGQILWTMERHTVGAVYLSYNHVICPMPPISTGPNTGVSGYAIKVTGGGHLTSPEVAYVIYNGQCMTCDQQKTCIQKPNTCHINGQCYRPGERDDLDHQGYCEPRVSLTSWTSGHPLVTPPHTGAFTSAPAVDTTLPPSTAAPVTVVHATAAHGGGVDHWTATSTGCACYFDTSNTDCACCQSFGCPCDQANRHQCSHCMHPESCGSTEQLFG